ncbi:hypothetical protein OVV29_32930, partial [Klebsiella pneumoniae]|nr:hypothetical protein [Klebsiella pneumoniae]
VVRDVPPAPASKKVARRLDAQPFGTGGDPLVADHDRIWAKHQTISDPEHVVAAKLLRRKRFDIVGPPHHVEVEQRLLTTYDTVLGLDGPVA